jgi:hypothetical protein
MRWWRSRGAGGRWRRDSRLWIERGGGGSWPNGEWQRGERGWMGGRGRSNIGRRGVRATQREEEDLNGGSPVAQQTKEEEWVA